VRRLAILPLIAAIALSACGSSQKTSVDTSFPPVEEQGDRAYAEAKDQNDAARLCITAIAAWPEEYSAYDEVTFRIPGPGRDYVCKRPQ
jgi:hypothetical protein